MSRLGGWRRRSSVRWASGPARGRWARQPGPARDAKAQNTLMRTMPHTTQITRPPTIPVIRSPVRLTRSVPRGARASRGPARSPDNAAVAGHGGGRVLARLRRRRLRPRGAGGRRPSRPRLSRTSPCRGSHGDGGAPTATHSEARASCDAFLTIWCRRGLGAARASRPGCALNEMRTLHEQARCHDGRCRVPTWAPGAGWSRESSGSPHGRPDAGRGRLRHWKRRSSHAHCPP